MTPPFDVAARVPCPRCGRIIAARTDGDHLRLIKHLTVLPNRVEAGRQWCSASDRVVVRSASGVWLLE
jgi:hypothetical protein